SVVRLARIVDGAFVRDQRAADSTNLNEPVPIAVVACQSRGLQHQHDSDLAQANFRCQSLEASTECRGAAGPALVFIDDFHVTRRPTQLDGSLAQVILPFRASAILGHLQPGGLPYVDKGRPLAMCAVNLRARHRVSSEVRLRRRRRASWVNRVSMAGGTG